MLQKRPQKPPSIVTRAADNRAIGCTINLLLIPALIILGLVLPPISLPERILDNGYRTINKDISAQYELVAFGLLVIAGAMSVVWASRMP